LKFIYKTCYKTLELYYSYYNYLFSILLILGIFENEKLLPLSVNSNVLTSTKCYEHHSTSDVKELIFSSPIMTTPKRRIENIIDMPCPNLKINCCDDDTPRKKKLKVQLQNQSTKSKNKRSRISKLKRSLQMFKIRNDVSKVINTFPFPSVNSKALVTMQIKKNHRPWPQEEKQLSIFLFYKSPAAYNFLKLQNVNLPGTSTICRWIGESKFLPGFSKVFLNHLKKKFEYKTDKEKKCTICFDEISIKKCLEFSKHFDFIERFEDF
jgi:hypothetical protein